VVGERGGAGRRLEDGLDQPLELAVDGDVPEWLSKADECA
jgi:hypothetical protein